MDAADYTVWRNNRGVVRNASTSQGDGDFDGDVDDADYTIWKNHFGQTAHSKATQQAVQVAAGFGDGEIDWELGQQGGSAAGQGSVEIAEGAATIREGDSFLVTLSRTFEVPDESSVVSFTFEGPEFDTTSTGAVRDAFEVALLDEHGNSLIHTIVPTRDAAFNITAGQAAVASQDVTLVGNRVTLDLSDALAGMSATLVFRLVNSDGDEQTSVRISDVEIPSVGILPVRSIDNRSWGYSERGLWQNRTNGGWQGNYRVLPAGSTTGSASWVTILPAANYEIFATWTPSATSAANAVYQIYDGATLVGTVTRNQQVAPTLGEFDNQLWDSLGTFSISSGVPTVKLLGNSAGSVAADGVLFAAPRTKTAALDREIAAAARQSTNVIDFRSLVDVSQTVQPVSAQTSFRENGSELFADIRLHNGGTYGVGGPLVVVIESVSDLAIQPTDFDGLTPEGRPYYDFSNFVSGSELSPGEEVGGRSLSFVNAARMPFTLDLHVMGRLNRAPAFTGEPDTEALANRSYSFTAQASDPDGDQLTFSAPIRPAGLSIDAATGVVTWKPTAADVGNHTVTLRVEDGRGGSDEQSFTIEVLASVPNRPPLFTSQPVIKATVGTQYHYDADAVDPDSDPLIYTHGPLTKSVPIINHSFEAQVLPEDQLTIGLITGWTLLNGASAGAWNPGPARYPGGLAPDGENIAFSNDPAITQILSERLTVNTRYTLRVAVGDRLDNTLNAFSVQLRAGGQLLASSSSPLPGNGTFIDIPVTFDAPADHAMLGQPLEIALSGSSGVTFDNVRLTATEIYAPPAGVTIDAVTGMVSWTPTVDQIGTHRVLLSASDGQGGVAVQSYNVEVEPSASNHAPVIVSEPATTLKTGPHTESPNRLTLNFEGLPAAPNFVQNSPVPPEARLSDQFLLSHGVTFRSDTGIPFIAVVNLGVGHAQSGALGIGGMRNETNIDYSAPIIAEFSLPGDLNTLALTDFVSIKADRAGDGQTIAMEAYDLSGRLLARTSLVDADGPTLSLAAIGIHSVKILGSSSSAFDDFTYGELYASELFEYDVEAIDEDSDTLTYSLTAAPPGAKIDTSAGRIKWYFGPADIGTQPVSVRVDDGHGGFDTQDFVVDVSHGQAGQISGTKFNDLNHNGVKDTAIFDNGEVQDIYNLVVRGSDAIYLAGRTDVSIPLLGASSPAFPLARHTFVNSDFVPETFPTPIEVAGGDVILLANPAIGGIHFFNGLGNASNRFGPEGNGVDGSNLTAVGGLSGYVGPQGALVGVFLDDANPAVGPPPATLNFNGVGKEFASLAPGLRQVFYIGDGRTSQGIAQQFIAPTGATRLFVGIADGASFIGPPGFYEDNDGTYEVRIGVNQNPNGTPIPEPGLPGWTVYLDQNENGQRDANERFTITDADGNYEFSSLAPDTYVVAEVNQPGWEQTGPASRTHTIVVGSGADIAEVNFGNRERDDTNNRPPAFNSVSPATARVGQAYQYQVSATDPDGNAIIFDLPVRPAGMVIDSLTGALAWRPLANQIGVQDAIVRAKDIHGAVTLQQFKITVAANSPPIITATPEGPAVVGRPYEARFRAQDADGDTVVFHVSQAPNGMTVGLVSGLVNWTPTAGQLGVQTIIVTALDDAGGQVTAAVQLEVVASAVNIAPAINSTPRDRLRLGGRYVYRVEASDASHDPIALSLSQAPAGMTIDPFTALIEWNPTPEQLGDNSVVVRADDGQGGVTLQLFVVEVVTAAANEPPQIVSTPVLTAASSQTYAYNLRGVDADGDPLVWSLDAAPSGMSFDPTLGTIRWTPADDQVGSSNVVVRVTDAQGGQAMQSFAITVSAGNRPPAISSTPVTQGTVGQAYLYAVEATDPDGDPLIPLDMLDCVDMPAGLVSWWRGDGNIDDAQGANDGALENGAAYVTGKVGLGFNFDGSNDYLAVPDNANLRPAQFTLEAWIRPNSTSGFDSVIAKGASGQTPGYHGDANGFWLGLADGIPRMYTGHFSGLDHFISGATALAPNQWHHLAGTFDGTTKALYADGVLVASATVASPIRYDSFAVPLTIGEDWVNGAASGQYQFHGQIDEPSVYDRALSAAQINAIFNADDGKCVDVHAAGFQLTSFPTGMTIDAATGLVQWTPTAGQAGPQNVTVRVEDGRGGQATQSYTVVVGSQTINRPPSITTLPSTGALAGQGYSYDADASDPEGGSLTFELRTAPAGMTINATTGAIGWTPNSSQVGSHPVTLAARDAAGNTAFQSYVLNVRLVNRPPAINSTPIQFATPNDVYRYDVIASDPDGDRLTYQLASAPGGMTIDASGRIAWPVGAADVGTHPITVTVTDLFGVSMSQSFDLVVSSDDEAPNVDVEFSESPANLGSLVTILVSAGDNVGVEELLLSVGGVPLTVDPSGRAEFSADQVGTFDVVVTATDAAGNSGQISTTLAVIDQSDANVPEVEITSPSDEAVITQPVDVIGTVDDDNLSFYTLEVAVLGSSRFSEIARGTSAVANGVLGTLDPTMLANDIYTLRLTAVDAGGNSSSVEQIVHVEGDLKLGNFALSFSDLTVPVLGVPITVARTYDTLSAGEARELGYGWRLEFRETNLRTSVVPTGLEDVGIFNPFNIRTRVYVTLPGGKRESFTFRPELADGLRGTFLGIFEPRFEPGNGVTSSLTVTPADLRLNALGEVFDYGTGTAYNPTSPLFGGTFVLTTKDGIAYRIDGRTGQLTTLSDTNDNILRFSDNGITGPGGVNVAFERDPQGRIISVIDPAGQRIRYQYDAQGDLVAVIDRANNSTHFVYRENPAHYLEQVIDPLGRTGIRAEYDAQGRLSNSVDAAGNPTRFTYDPSNQIATVTDALGHQTIEEYDSRGNTLTHIDALGAVTRRTFDIDNNQLTETDALGRTTTFTYNDRGDVLTQTNPLGETTISTYETFTYGVTAEAAVEGKAALPFTRVKSLTDPLGNTTRNNYDRKGNLIARTDPLGNVTSTDYDSAGYPILFIDALGNTSQNAYDGSGNRTQLVDPKGHVSNFSYDANGNPLSQTQEDGSGWNLNYNAEGLPTNIGLIGVPRSFQYDAVNQITQFSDASGTIATLSYDVLGNMTQLILADGTIPVTNTYDAEGNLLTTTDSLGNATRYTYDAVNRLVQTTFADGSTEKLTYNLSGELVELVDALGNDTQYVYDAAGREIQVIDATGGVTGTQYDAAGRTVAMTDPLGHTTRIQYDANGQRIAIIAPDGATTRSAYDANGRLSQTIDAVGNVTTSTYDAAGNLVSVTDALGNITHYEYGDNNERVATVDANGHTTRYRYDTQGHVIETTQPNGDTDSSTYDSAGRLATTTDGNGKTTSYGYDVRGRMTTRTLPDGSQETYTYTSDGLVSSFTDARGITQYEYDPVMRRLVQVANPDGTQVNYAYDAAGNRTSLTATTGATSLTTNFTFDTLNRLATVTDPDLGVTRYTYDAANNLVRTELPNGVVETRSYDDSNRLLFLENSGPSGAISSQLYTLTPTGHRASMIDHDGRRVDYTYDDLDRLTREAITDAVFGDRTIDYTFDPVGNRLTRDDSAQGLTEYTYDINDRLLTETLAGDVTQYSYDDNGNMLSRASATDSAFYHWDFKNRLVSADTDGDGTVDLENEYDDNSIRVSQTAGGQETRYLIDPLEQFAKVVLEYRPSGVVVASNVFGHELISQERDGVRVFYHADGLGSTRALTDGAGAVLNRYVYDAFGRILNQSGGTSNSYLFAGEQRDMALGLDYLRARYYDPATGRFVSRDTYSGSDVNPLSRNRYLYALANPVNYTDPSGNISLIELAGSDTIQKVLRFAERAVSAAQRANSWAQGILRALQYIGGAMTLYSAGVAFADPARAGSFFTGLKFGVAKVPLGIRSEIWLIKTGAMMVRHRLTYLTTPLPNDWAAAVEPKDSTHVYLDPVRFLALHILPIQPLELCMVGALVHEFAHLRSAGAIGDKTVLGGPAYGIDALRLNPPQALYNADNYRIAVQAIVFGIDADDALNPSLHGAVTYHLGLFKK